jgi:hypothetical protein
LDDNQPEGQAKSHGGNKFSFPTLFLY